MGAGLSLCSTERTRKHLRLTEEGEKKKKQRRIEERSLRTRIRLRGFLRQLAELEESIREKTPERLTRHAARLYYRLCAIEFANVIMPLLPEILRDIRNAIGEFLIKTPAKEYCTP